MTQLTVAGLHAMRAAIWRFRNAGLSVGGAALIMVLVIGVRVGTRFMVSPRPKPTRLWRCSMSGLMWIGRIANLLIGGPGWAGSGWRPQQ